MSKAIGIDLGTSYSAVAILRTTGKPEILLNQDGDPITPSVVMFQDWGAGDEPLVGIQAKNMAATAPDDVAQFVKRQMGEENWRFDTASGSTYTAEEVSAIILKRLKQDAEVALGEEVTDAVITVPAYFDDARRTATKQAGKIAGLNVLRVLNEPTAAALSYGLDAENSGTTLVYDLGGGTFDVTLMCINGTEFDVLGTDGDRNLGGFDFDNSIVAFVAKQMELQGAKKVLDDLEASAALREKAEQAKRSLTTVGNTNVHMSFGGKQYRIPVTREDFERVTQSLVTRTREIMEDVLEDAQLTWNQIDNVLLIGGSTRMPMIREMVQSVSGKPVELNVNPDEAVALGAAIQAALETVLESVFTGGGASGGHAGGIGTEIEFFQGKSIDISDVTSQSLGVLAVDTDDDTLKNWTVISRNEKVPSKGSQDLETGGTRTSLTVQVTQGEDSDPDFVTVVGEGTITLPEVMPVGTPFRVTYHYDVDQTIFVELTDLRSNKLIGTFDIDRGKNMSQNDMVTASARVSSLKIS